MEDQIPVREIGRSKTIRFIDIKAGLLNGARCRARAKGIPFNITSADITVPDLCPALGIPLGVTPGKLTDSTPTLDRIYNFLGYVRGNVVVVSWRANRLKNNADIHELRALADFYEGLIKGAWMSHMKEAPK